MITHGVEGFLIEPGATNAALGCMEQIYSDEIRRKEMGAAGRSRFAKCFDLNIMVQNYRRLLFTVSPPTILVDMDGTLVDWDKGFIEHFGASNSISINRSKSYFMADCLPVEVKIFIHISRNLLIQLN